MSKSLVVVHVGQNLCLAASLFLGKFRLTHEVEKGGVDYRSWKHLINKKSIGRVECEVIAELRMHGLPVGKKYDLSDIDTIQARLYPEFQIVVFSADHGNSVISRSPSTKIPGMKEIVVYYSKGHFDLITNFDGFLMKGYHCEHCEKSCSNREQHRCEGVCPLCYWSNTECAAGTKLPCADCGRTFRNADCHRMHKTTNKSGWKICDSCSCAKTVSYL